MSDPDAPWRVYLPEWLTVYTSDQMGEAGIAECQSHFAVKYEGRVHREDVVVTLARAGRPSPACLKLRLPNLKAEHKDHDLAQVWLQGMVSDMPEDTRGGWIGLVQRGSDEEKELLAYGVKMLPGGAGE